MKKGQRILKVRRKVLADGTHQKTSVGITEGGRICVTEEKTKKLNKKGDFSVTSTKTYKAPTEASIKNLGKLGVKVRVVKKGSQPKKTTATKKTTKVAQKKKSVKRTTAKSRSSKSKRK